MMHGLLAVALHTGLVAGALSSQNEDWDGISYLHTTAVEANVNLSIPSILDSPTYENKGATREIDVGVGVGVGVGTDPFYGGEAKKKK